MLKQHILKLQKSTTDQDYEKCVVCGKETVFPINMDISSRVFYIRGVGQLCKRCYRELYEG